MQSALKVGGLEGLKEIFTHPLLNIPTVTIRVWLATLSDPNFAAKENQDLEVVKAKRSPVSKLDLSPFSAPSQTLVQLP